MDWIGNRCLETREYLPALKSFSKSENREKLDLLGKKLMEEEEISLAMKAFSLAGNSMMVEFIKKNFQNAQV